MSEQPTHQPTPARRGMRRLLLSLLVLVAVVAAAALLSPEAARADECMGGESPPSVGDGLDCGGGGEEPPPAPPGEGGRGGGGGGGGWCNGVVVLYEHTNFGGRCWAFSAGETGWVGGDANDQASSIWVADGYVATIFLHAWFDGAAHNTDTTQHPWGWADIGNDNVSSLVVQPSEPEWSYYWGDSETTEPDDANALVAVAASGCAKVGAAVAHRNLYRRLWRFALLTRFCWNGSSVNAVWEREVAVDIDPVAFPLSLIQGWRYTPVAFERGEAGYSSTVLRADGRFDYCGFRYGCITTQQPWVRIELYANGRAVCMTSVRGQALSCERVDS